MMKTETNLHLGIAVLALLALCGCGSGKLDLLNIEEPEAEPETVIPAEPQAPDGGTLETLVQEPAAEPAAEPASEPAVEPEPAEPVAEENLVEEEPVELPPPSRDFFVTGYYSWWGACAVRPSEIDWSTFTHVVHMYLEPSRLENDPGGWGRGGTGPGSTGGAYWHADGHDLDFLENASRTGCSSQNADGTWTYPVQRQLIDEAHAHGRKVLLNLGGMEAPPDGDTTANFTWIVQNGHLDEYLDSIFDYITLRGYDGVDIDWERPWNDTDRTALHTILRELRRRLDAMPQRGELGYLAWGTALDIYPQPDPAVVNATVDQFSFMAYNYTWGSNYITHYNAGLYPWECPLDTQVVYNGEVQSEYRITSTQAEDYISYGFDPKIFGVGMPFGGREYLGADRPCQMSQTQHGSGWEFFYQYYVDNRNNPGAVEGWDDRAQVPWLGWTDAGGQRHFFSFENARSVAEKVRYARAQGMGGVMTWEIARGVSDEGDRQPLVAGIRDGLAN